MYGLWLRLFGNAHSTSLIAAHCLSILIVISALAQANFDNDVHNSLDSATNYHDAWHK
jgi:hypothetical protein